MNNKKMRAFVKKHGKEHIRKIREENARFLAEMKKKDNNRDKLIATR